MRTYYFAFFLLFSSIGVSSQGVLIEEFTNVGSDDYEAANFHVENLMAEIGSHNFCVIDYHTNYPASDPFNINVNEDVQKRMTTLQGISALSAVVVDAHERPTGNNFTGATLNLDGEYLDSIEATKGNVISFYSLKLEYDDDFKAFDVSTGMSLFGNDDLDVRLYQVLVEEFIEDDSPIDQFGNIIPTNIFRGFITYGEFWDIPGNGSTQGWRAGDVPNNIVDINNLKVIVFAEDLNGNVIACSSFNAPTVPTFRTSFSNSTSPQSDYCDNSVTPRITIINEGALDLTGLNVQAIINKDTIAVQISNTLTANENIIYSFDEMILPPGDYDIKVRLVSVENAPLSMEIRETTTIATDIVSNYLIPEIYEAPNEGFESGAGCGRGDFYLRAQTDHAFNRVNGLDLGVNHAVGGFGNSDHCLMVDQWSWEYNDETAISLLNNDDEPNAAFLHYNGFDLSSIENPFLQFDFAGFGIGFSSFLKIEINTDSCSNSFELIEEFLSSDLNTADPNFDTYFVPDSSQWRSVKIPLYDFEQEPFVQLRFFVSHKNMNGFYFDNIKVLSESEQCLDGNVQLTSQAEVDEFVQLMDGCNILPGDLCIGFCDGENEESDITDLSGLSSLLDITGSLRISQNPLLTSIDGLHRLRSIGADLEVNQNAQLISIFDLAPDKIIGGNIQIVDNLAMERILNLSNLDIINGDFIVSGNPLNFNIDFGDILRINGNCTIKDLAGASSIGSIVEYVAGDFVLENNANLRFAHNFLELISIEGSLTIKNTPRFGSLFWVNLEKIGGNFEISGVDSLEEFALFSLDTIGGHLILEGNKNLENINAFDSLSYELFNAEINNAEDLIIRNNPSLSLCSSEFVCRIIGDANRVFTIDGNAIGCETGEQVSNICINGFDLDNDGFGDLVDCNDQDPNINPDAVEICDGIDNNCDDQIDEGLTFVTYYVDADMDGYGDDNNIVSACAQPAGTTTVNGDCDDQDPAINPGAIDIPNNGIDEDCDDMDTVSSIHELSNSRINIFPNPATEIINIEVSQHLDYAVGIFNFSGGLIMQFLNMEKIDVHTLPMGAYLLEVKDLNTGHRVVERIIIAGGN